MALIEDLDARAGKRPGEGIGLRSPHPVAQPTDCDVHRAAERVERTGLDGVALHRVSQDPQRRRLACGLTALCRLNEVGAGRFQRDRRCLG